MSTKPTAQEWERACNLGMQLGWTAARVRECAHCYAKDRADELTSQRKEPEAGDKLLNAVRELAQTDAQRLLDDLLQDAFSLLHHDGGPQDKEYVWLRSKLRDSFAASLAKHRRSLADRAETESQREGQQWQWMPIETAPLGSFLVWIPSTNMAWPAWKENNGRIFSNAHGPLNELDYGDGRFIEATHWHEKLPPPEPCK